MDSCGTGFVVVLLIVGVLWFVHNYQVDQLAQKKAAALREYARILEQQTEAAFQTYQKSLDKLRNDPNNPLIRQQTLSLGREYSSLTRNRRGVTVFDEVALKNDIDAACAGAVSVQDRSLERERSTLAVGSASDRISESSNYTKSEFRFRVYAAEKESGEETIFEIKAATVQDARTKVTAAGYLISRIEPVS